MNKIRNIGVLFGTTLIVLLIGELFATILSNLNPWAPPTAINTQCELMYKANWNGVCTYCRKYTVQTNSRGLRERELPFQKENNVIKLLFLGDSITFGSGVESDKTFVRIVETLLNRSSTVKKYEIINAGISGASIIHEINLLKKVGLKYQPDIVILNFYLNDIRPPKHNKQSKDSGIFKHFVRKSELYKLLKKGYCFLRIKLILKEIPLSEWWNADIIKQKNWKKDKNIFDNLLHHPAAYGDWGLAWQEKTYFYEQYRKHIKELKQLEKLHGFKLVIVCFPVYFQVGGDFLEDEPQRVLSIISEEKNIPFFDLLPFLRTKEAEQNEFNKSLYIDHCHLDIEGHRVVAKAVTEKLYSILGNQ